MARPSQGGPGAQSASAGAVPPTRGPLKALLPNSLLPKAAHLRTMLLKPRPCERVPLAASPPRAVALGTGPLEALPLGGAPPGAGTLRAAAQYLVRQHRHLRHC
jgi:hypothetical protein